MLKKLWIFLLIFNPLYLFSTDIKVIVKNVFFAKKGTLFVSVCDKKNFSIRGDNTINCLNKKTKVLPQKSIYEFVFKNVEPGEYVISGFQDIDGNNKLTTNWIGMPKEPVFFSVKLTGPPTFNKVKSVIDGKNQTVVLTGVDF